MVHLPFINKKKPNIHTKNTQHFSHFSKDRRLTRTGFSIPRKKSCFSDGLVAVTITTVTRTNFSDGLMAVTRTTMVV